MELKNHFKTNIEVNERPLNIHNYICDNWIAFTFMIIILRKCKLGFWNWGVCIVYDAMHAQ